MSVHSFQCTVHTDGGNSCGISKIISVELNFISYTMSCIYSKYENTVLSAGL